MSGRLLHRGVFLKNYLILLLCILAPYTVLCGAIACQSQREMTRIIDANSRNLLRQTRDKVELLLEEVSFLYTSLSVNQSVMDVIRRCSCEDLPGTAHVELRKTVQSLLIPSVVARSYIHSIYIYIQNDNGRFVDAIEGLLPLSMFYDTQWLGSYEKQRDTHMEAWSEARAVCQYPFMSEPTQIVSLYRKPYLQDGVIVLNLYADHLRSIIDDLKLSEDQTLFVFNEAGEMLIVCGEPLQDADQWLLADGAAGDFTITGYAHNGVPYLVSGLRGSMDGWTYISAVPADSIYRVPRQVFSYAAVAIAAGILICCVFSYTYVRRSSRNIQKILSLFNKSDRDLAQKLPIRSVRRIFTINEYETITENVIKTFLEQNNLRRQLDDKENQKKMLELSALQSQISPHFLLNTVRSIFWMSFKLTGSQNEVSDMVESLSSILDYALNAPAGTVSLAQELENARNYVAIQQMRYKGRFTVSFQYPSTALPCRCIKLLLQPLIENAISHGIRWDEARVTHIRARVRMRPNHMEVSVSDDGAGIPEERLQEIRKWLWSGADSGHIGMCNCNRRLMLTFGPAFGLSIKSRHGSGTCVRARLPLSDWPAPKDNA